MKNLIRISLCYWFLDNNLSITFGEDKTKTILFSPKNLKKRAEPLLVKRNGVILKKLSSVEYLGCLIDSVLSDEDMALKVLTKVNGKLRFLYRQGKYLNKRLRRMLCNTIIQPHFDYASSAWYPNLSRGLKKKLKLLRISVSVIVFTLLIGKVLDTIILKKLISYQYQKE